jgi:hypothetical protein
MKPIRQCALCSCLQVSAKLSDHSARFYPSRGVIVVTPVIPVVSFKRGAPTEAQQKSSEI